jgi:hypothetical protein
MYEKRSGPIRADAINLGVLQPIDARAEQVFIAGSELVRETWSEEPTAYSLPGLETSKGFVLLFPPNLAPTACPAGLTVFTADGAKPSPAPFSYPSPAARPDGSIPTPVPTPTNRPFFELSIHGLLAAGWPEIWWDGAIIEYRGKTYRVTVGGYLDFGTADTSIPSDVLSAVESLELTYLPPVVLPDVLEPLRSDVPVTDRPDIAEVSSRGPLTPDHVIYTKPRPVVLTDNPVTGVDAFRTEYLEYFARHAMPALVPLDAAPRWAVWSGVGLVYFGRSAKEAGVVRDLIRHTVRAIGWSEAIGGWKPIDEADTSQSSTGNWNRPSCGAGLRPLRFRARSRS